MHNTNDSLRLLSGKWKLELLYHLSGGCVRWGALIHSIPAAAPNVLTRQLRALEQEGLVLRIITSAQPPQVVEYTLSDAGKSLLPQIHALAAWSGEIPGETPDFSACERVISSRWMRPILFALSTTLRFGSLQEQLQDISRGVLAAQLAEAREMGLISQTRYKGFPPRVEYALTSRGRRLLEILCSQEPSVGIHENKIP